MADFEKPSNTEDEYFAREDIEKKRKLAFKQAQETEQQRRDELKKLHFMKCPRCGMDLHALKKGDVEVDTCFHCKGVWLDAGELEHLMDTMGQENSGKVMKAVLGLFQR